MNKLNDEQRRAYEWAKNQNYQSVAARYAKLLAELIDDAQRENEQLRLNVMALEHISGSNIHPINKNGTIRITLDGCGLQPEQDNSKNIPLLKDTSKNKSDDEIAAEEAKIEKSLNESRRKFKEREEK